MLTPAQLAFLKSRIVDRAVLDHGQLMHLDALTLAEYTAIVKQFLDPRFVLRRWCGHCVYQMVRRVWVFALPLL
jgi:hypothetical protein